MRERVGVVLPRDRVARPRVRRVDASASRRHNEACSERERAFRPLLRREVFALRGEAAGR